MVSDLWHPHKTKEVHTVFRMTSRGVFAKSVQKTDGQFAKLSIRIANMSPSFRIFAYYRLHSAQSKQHDIMPHRTIGKQDMLRCGKAQHADIAPMATSLRKETNTTKDAFQMEI